MSYEIFSCHITVLARASLQSRLTKIHSYIITFDYHPLGIFSSIYKFSVVPQCTPTSQLSRLFLMVLSYLDHSSDTASVNYKEFFF